MGIREERLAQNQEDLRVANERLIDMLDHGALNSRIVPFLCECADDECLGRVELTLAQYEDAHVLPDTYVILRGHPRIEDEEVLEEHGGFMVVQKGA